MVVLKLLACCCWVNVNVICECFWVFGLRLVAYVSSAYKCFITRSYVEMGWIVVIVMVCGLKCLTFEVLNGDFFCYNCEKNIDNNVIFHLGAFRSPNSNLTEHDRKIPPLPPLSSTCDSSNPSCTPRRPHKAFATDH